MEQPPRERVTKAVQEAQAAAAAEGKVLKVLYLSEDGEPVGEFTSAQLPENAFAGVQGVSGLMTPPFAMEQLVYLAESHPVHSAAIEQKVADVCGKGWEWLPIKDDAEDEGDAEKEKINAWFEAMSPDDVDMREVIEAVWNDHETCGWGLVEVARDKTGIVRHLYHVPAHTVRAHKDGFRLCQIRDSRKVWFRRWGCPEIDNKEVQVDSKTGSMRSVRSVANDLFVVKRPSRRSSWYGIPGYISAVGWITLALAARDDNLMFFANRREPRWAIILTNLQDSPDLEEDLRRAMTVDLRQPYRNLMIPIQGKGDISFQKLTDNRMDGSFGDLGERANQAIMIAHRVPAERLANSKVGPLGGNSTEAASRVYKEGVVTQGQELLNSRLNRFISVEFEREFSVAPTYRLEMDDLDIETDREELALTAIAFHGNIITLREARHRLKLGPLKTKPLDPATGEVAGDEIESPHNELLFTELPGSNGAAGNPGTNPAGTGGLLQNSREDRDGVALALLEADVLEMIRQGRATERALVELVEKAETSDTSSSRSPGA